MNPRWGSFDQNALARQNTPTLQVTNLSESFFFPKAPLRCGCKRVRNDVYLKDWAGETTEHTLVTLSKSLQDRFGQSLRPLTDGKTKCPPLFSLIPHEITAAMCPIKSLRQRAHRWLTESHCRSSDPSLLQLQGIQPYSV